MDRCWRPFDFLDLYQQVNSTVQGFEVRGNTTFPPGGLWHHAHHGILIRGHIHGNMLMVPQDRTEKMSALCFIGSSTPSQLKLTLHT